MPPGPRRQPPDTVIPSWVRESVDVVEAFPFAEYIEWTAGDTIHSYEDEIQR